MLLGRSTHTTAPKVSVQQLVLCSSELEEDAQCVLQSLQCTLQVVLLPANFDQCNKFWTLQQFGRGAKASYGDPGRPWWQINYRGVRKLHAINSSFGILADLAAIQLPFWQGANDGQEMQRGLQVGRRTLVNHIAELVHSPAWAFAIPAQDTSIIWRCI